MGNKKIEGLSLVVVLCKLYDKGGKKNPPVESIGLAVTSSREHRVS
jgi:hypothetical protein